MSDVIKYEDFVQPGALEKLIAEGRELETVFSKTAETMKKAITSLKGSISGGSPKNVADVEQINNSIKKVNEFNDVLVKAETQKKRLSIETAKLKQEEANYNQIVKNAAKDELGMISLYQKESIRLNDLRKAYKDLVLAKKEDSVAGKALLKNLTDLDAKLKHVDATVGQHQRNVGNYTSALQDAKTGLMQIGAAMGIAFGVHQVVDFGKESVGAFLEAEENAHRLKSALEGNSLAFSHLMKQSAELQDKGIFSDDDVQIAQQQLAVFGLTGDQVEKLTPQIADLAAKMKWSLAEATEKSISAINGQTKGLKLAGITFKDTGSKTENLALLTEKLTKFQGANAEALETTIGKTKRLANAFDDFKEIVGEYLVNEGVKILDNFETVFGDANVVKVRQTTEKVIKAMDEVNIKTLENAKKSEAQRLEAVAMTERNIQKIAKDGLAATNANSKKVMAAQLKNQQNLLDELNRMAEKQVIEDDATAGAKEKSVEDFGKKLRDLETENIRISYDRKKKEIQDNFDDETKKYAGHTEILVQLAIKRGNALEDLWRDHEKEMQKIRDNAIKQEGMAKMEAEDVGFSKSVAADIENKKKKAELQKEQDKKDRENAITHAEDLLNIWREAEDRKAAENMAYNDHQLEQNKSAIDQQLALATAGNDSTLAYEMDKQNRLEKERVQELERQKKVAKQQEAVELALAFLKAYETYISQDMKSGQALLRASGDIMTAKLLSKAIAGSAFEGTEDTGGAGSVDSKGGKLWVLHPNERVLSKEQNDQLKGISNDDLVRNALMFDSIMKPNFDSSLALSDVSRSKQVGDSLTGTLISEIRNLTQTVKDKPETSYSFDGLGHLIETRIERGITYITKKKTFLD